MIYAFGSIAVIAALAMVLSKQPIRSALSLLTCMLALAGIYALRGAHLIFALQLIIYVGAIMVFLIAPARLRQERSFDSLGFSQNFSRRSFFSESTLNKSPLMF